MGVAFVTLPYFAGSDACTLGVIKDLGCSFSTLRFNFLLASLFLVELSSSRGFSYEISWALSL
jgi:hypothetical protein